MLSIGNPSSSLTPAFNTVNFTPGGGVGSVTEALLSYVFILVNLKVFSNSLAIVLLIYLFPLSPWLSSFLLPHPLSSLPPILAALGLEPRPSYVCYARTLPRSYSPSPLLAFRHLLLNVCTFDLI